LPLNGYYSVPEAAYFTPVGGAHEAFEHPVISK